MKYFVWVKNLHGIPEAQILMGKKEDWVAPGKVLISHEISEADDKMPIRELMEKYKYEAK